MKETVTKVWEIGNFLTGAPLEWDTKIAAAMSSKLNQMGLNGGAARYGTVRVVEGDPVRIEMVAENAPEVNDTPAVTLAKERVAEGQGFVRTWQRASFILRTLGFDKIVWLAPAVAELEGRVKELEEERAGIEDLENRISDLERQLEERRLEALRPKDEPTLLDETQKIPGVSGNYVELSEDTELDRDFEIVVRFRDGTELPLREAVK